MHFAKWKEDIAFLWQFSIDDFKKKYAGSAMGFAWAFLNPLMTILVYWFVFQVGFKSQPVEGYPFILWLVSGIVPWFFYSEGIISVTTTLLEYSFLVKKIVFNIDILPLVKVLSAFVVQIFLVAITIILFCVFGYYPDLFIFQLIYYMTYMLLLVIGIGFLASALDVFFRDLVQIIGVLMQVVFWTTPIVWNFDTMPEIVRKILVYNPLYYIIQGYRDTFINKKPFWDNWKMGLYYWIFAGVLLMIGLKVYNKMKVHFADVL